MFRALNPSTDPCITPAENTIMCFALCAFRSQMIDRETIITIDGGTSKSRIPVVSPYPVGMSLSHREIMFINRIRTHGRAAQTWKRRCRGGSRAIMAIAEMVVLVSRGLARYVHNVCSTVRPRTAKEQGRIFSIQNACGNWHYTSAYCRDIHRQPTGLVHIHYVRH